MLYHAFSLSLAWFGAICTALLSNCIKKCTLMFFLKNVGSTWLPVAYSSKPGKSQIKYTVTRVVRCSSYGNALHYGLSMFVEIEKLSYPSVILISVKLNVLPHITKLYEHV